MSLTPLARRRTSREIALYVVPHQDDEALTLGAAMMADRAAGRRVYAIIVTDGKLDATRTTSITTLLGYTPSYRDFTAARDREFAAGVRLMGGIPIVPPFEARQPDGSSTPSGIVALVKAVVPFRGSNVLLRATAPNDYHADHRNCGHAVTQLWQEGFGVDPRLFISGYKSGLFPAGVTMTPMGSHGDLTLALQAPYRVTDVPNGWWGNGYRSVPAWFNYVLNNDGRSYWHPPI